MGAACEQRSNARLELLAPQWPRPAGLTHTCPSLSRGTLAGTNITFPTWAAGIDAANATGNISILLAAVNATGGSCASVCAEGLSQPRAMHQASITLTPQLLAEWRATWWLSRAHHINANTLLECPNTPPTHTSTHLRINRRRGRRAE